MTLAERYRFERPANWETAGEFIDFVQSIDPNVVFDNHLGVARMTFSDGSTHILGSNDQNATTLNVKPS
jgi:hypothetical protein